MVGAVAAGNSGPGEGTISSPGSAARALTAGASTVPHYIGAPVTVNGTMYGAAVADFGVATNTLTAPLAVVTNGSGGRCPGLLARPARSPASPIGLVSRRASPISPTST